MPQSSVEFTDNALRVLNSLDDLEVFRVTGIAAFHQCPARWKAEQLGEVAGGRRTGGGGSSSKYAEMGTAAHVVIERFLEDTNWRGWEQEEELLVQAGMIPSERGKVREYLENVCAALRPHKIVTELRLHDHPAGTDTIGVAGTLDLVCYQASDGVWEIWDHKTNRQFEGAEDWKVRIQPRFYTWLLRRFLRAQGHQLEFPIRYNIGYVLLGQVVTWDCPEETALETELLFVHTLEEFKVYKRTGNWPERINQWCASCPLIGQCKTAQAALNDLAAIAEEVQETRTALEYFVFLSDVKAMAEGLLDIERGAIKMVMEQEGSTEWAQAGVKATLSRSSRRKAEYRPIWRALADTAMSDEEANAMFTVRLGGLDAYVKRNPDVAMRLVGLVESEQAEEATLTVRRQK